MKKIKVQWQRDDWYTTYLLNKPNSKSKLIIEIPIDKFMWVHKTFQEFEKVQTYLDSFID